MFLSNKLQIENVLILLSKKISNIKINIIKLIHEIRWLDYNMNMKIVDTTIRRQVRMINDVAIYGKCRYLSWNQNIKILNPMCVVFQIWVEVLQPHEHLKNCTTSRTQGFVNSNVENAKASSRNKVKERTINNCEGDI